MNFANIVSLLGAFVATSVVVGLLGAGLVMPAVGATGAVARTGVHAFDSLPSDFTQTPLSQQSRILADDGTLISTPYDENRVIVPLAKIAPVMRQAQIAIEDNRFYEHAGIDPQGVGRAFVSNLGGGDTQGASTLTQQYVKITLQENALNRNDTLGAKAATAKSYARKVQELKYAITLEKSLTKNQILEGYLNIVYFGGQAYGVEAAGRNPGRSGSAPERDRPDQEPGQGPGPAQRRARPDAHPEPDHRRGLAGCQGDQDGDQQQADPELLCPLALPLLLHLRHGVAGGPAGTGRND